MVRSESRRRLHAESRGIIARVSVAFFSLSPFLSLRDPRAKETAALWAESCLCITLRQTLRLPYLSARTGQ